MQNCDYKCCRQGATLPLDPDSVITPQAEMVQQPNSPLVQMTPSGSEAAVATDQSSQSNSGPDQPSCGPTGLCLPQPYPVAKANAENERYARIIRNSFAGCESTLTAMMTYLYQSMRFGDCADDLREMLAAIAQCKMYHLKLLGELLLSLGGDPKYFYCTPPNFNSGSWWAAQPTIVTYSKILGDALTADIAAEKASIEEHNSTINYVDDEGIRALLKRIVLDEEYHLKILTELHKRFCS
ncbi:MAG TPA: ferritin-like domain-containing protein [Clostridia bacterium]|nr:ferritin-like domain-containing protein [Clostridia bacterium]